MIPEHDIEGVYREQRARLYHAVLGFSGDPEMVAETLAVIEELCQIIIFSFA